MKKIIIYYSMTGNTESIANKIKADTSSEIRNVSDITVEESLNYDVIILGCPAMGGEQLESDIFEPFNNELFSKAREQIFFLFGSYGWGSGEWMENWTRDAINQGIKLGSTEGLIVNGDESDIIEEKYQAFINSINNL